MGLLDTLASIGGIIGAPFTGGLSLMAGPLAGLMNSDSAGSQIPGQVANVAGGAASGLANQRSQQAQLASAQGNLSQKNYQDQLNAMIMQKLGLPAAGAQMAAKGDVQANIQDMTPQFTPGMGYSFSGGMRPSLLGPNARQAGQNLSNAGLSAQSAQLPSMWQMPNFPSTTPTGLESGLQYGALGAGLLGSLSKSPLQQMLAKMGGQQNSGQVPGDVTDAQSQLQDPNDPNPNDPFWQYGSS